MEYSARIIRGRCAGKQNVLLRSLCYTIVKDTHFGGSIFDRATARAEQAPRRKGIQGRTADMRVIRPRVWHRFYECSARNV